jgi:hypothetical protein
MDVFMNDFSEVKLEIFIPATHVEALRLALGQVGAGRIGNYDHCCSVTEVRGYWRPLDGADPYQGEIGKIEQGSECKVEVNCRRELVAAALAAVRRVHPYEEPLINIIPLANSSFE